MKQELCNFAENTAMDMKLLIFDFDGTLGDTNRNIVTTMQMTIAEMHLPERSNAQCSSTIGLPLAGCFAALFPGMDESVYLKWAETYRRIFADNLRHISPQPFPHVKETLKSLSEQGVVLTIASSRSHASLVELIHGMGISSYFSFLIGADDVEHAKPEPEPVLNILAATHTDARDTLVVGDMAVDILMGARAGALTCGVTWGNGSRHELEQAGADYIIESIDELENLIV